MQAITAFQNLISIFLLSMNLQNPINYCLNKNFLPVLAIIKVQAIAVVKSMILLIQILQSLGNIFYLFQRDHHKNLIDSLNQYLWICLSVMVSYFCGQKMYFVNLPEVLSTKYRQQVVRLVKKQKSLLLRLIQLYKRKQYNYKLLMQEKGRIYLLIGYLGSGKTTFIRNLLHNKQDHKYAVIQNQFAEGQMGIEQPLIMDESGVPFSSFLQLPNGCICCSAKNDLVAGVEYILNNTDVRNIVVETNGLADPAEAIKQFWFDDKLEMNAQLHSIITIISVQKYPALQQDQLFMKQVVYANKVLLTFIDKSAPEQIDEVYQAVRSCNRQCQIAKNHSYDIVQFLEGKNMFDVKSLMEQTKQHSEHAHHGKMHHGISSISIRGQTLHQTKNAFECAVGSLLWESDQKILRIKGVISLGESPNAFQLQGVDDIFQLKDTKTIKQKVDNQTIILVIGKKINEKQIREILKVN